MSVDLVVRPGERVGPHFEPVVPREADGLVRDGHDDFTPRRLPLTLADHHDGPGQRQQRVDAAPNQAGSDGPSVPDDWHSAAERSLQHDAPHQVDVVAAIDIDRKDLASEGGDRVAHVGEGVGAGLLPAVDETRAGLERTDERGSRHARIGSPRPEQRLEVAIDLTTAHEVLDHALWHEHGARQHGPLRLEDLDQAEAMKRSTPPEPGSRRRVVARQAGQLQGQAHGDPAQADVVVEVAVEALEAPIEVGGGCDHQQRHVDVVETEPSRQTVQTRLVRWRHLVERGHDPLCERLAELADPAVGQRRSPGQLLAQLLGRDAQAPQRVGDTSLALFEQPFGQDRLERLETGAADRPAKRRPRSGLRCPGAERPGPWLANIAAAATGRAVVGAARSGTSHPHRSSAGRRRPACQMAAQKACCGPQRREPLVNGCGAPCARLADGRPDPLLLVAAATDDLFGLRFQICSPRPSARTALPPLDLSVVVAEGEPRRLQHRWPGDGQPAADERCRYDEVDARLEGSSQGVPHLGRLAGLRPRPSGGETHGDVLVRSAPR